MNIKKSFNKRFNLTHFVPWTAARALRKLKKVITQMKNQTFKAILIFLFSIPLIVNAECNSSLPVKGALSIKFCDPNVAKCVPANEAIYKYTTAIKDDPDVFTIGSHSSPWHFYDAQMRILTIDDMASRVKQKLKNEKRVELTSSWSGVPPDSKTLSLAQKLSKALGGIPVTGVDGFVWLNKNGHYHTTKQAYTMWQSHGPYMINEGDDVMVSLATYYPVQIESYLIENRIVDGILDAGAGWEIFNLCQDKALQRFELAATYSQPIAAYNAAIIHIERNNPQDQKIALDLLRQASKLGDEKSSKLLSKLSKL